MSKLLKEAQIRRFMKLANIDALTDNFIVEDKPYTAKKEEPGEDKRKGAEKRGAEGTLAKTPGHEGHETKSGDVGGGKYGKGGHYKDYEMNEESEEESELHATEDELGAEDHEADAEGDEIADLEADLGAEEAMGGDVSEEDVVDIVATIADALEDKYGIAVDVESGDDAGPEDVAVDDMEAEVDMEVGGDELDVEMVDDEEIVAEVLKRVTARLRAAMKENKKTKITRK
mgnify:CR=1 FL=1